MDIQSIVPLDENSLLERARANTGLSNFGFDPWHEPFQILIKALDQESELNLMGRLMTRSDLLLFLEARLRIEEAYRQHPEIADEEIRSPLFIIGQGRTGTSELLHVLASDPNNRAMLNWEVTFPTLYAERANQGLDPRIEKTSRLQSQYERVTPETRGYMSRARLALMKPSAYLLNFGRGELIVDADLIEAVKARTIAGAVLDVFTTEPLPAEHPFWGTEGIAVLPHIGGFHPQRASLHSIL